MYVQAGDSESGAGFVKPADGDAGFALPVGDEAAVAERPAQIPSQEAEAQDPEYGEGCVVDEVVSGREGAEEV